MEDEWRTWAIQGRVHPENETGLAFALTPHSEHPRTPRGKHALKRCPHLLQTLKANKSPPGSLELFRQFFIGKIKSPKQIHTAPWQMESLVTFQPSSLADKCTKWGSRGKVSMFACLEFPLVERSGTRGRCEGEGGRRRGLGGELGRTKL